MKELKTAINEAKDFSINFENSFGTYPLLFFSGGKGCHAYTFFERLQKIDINRALSWLGYSIKKNYSYNTLDLSVLKDAKVRLSRVPYSKHQYTGLSVVPFSIEDSYDQIIHKSLDPIIEPFNMGDYISTLGDHLKKIDPIIKHNEMVKHSPKIVKNTEIHGIKSFKKVLDHRDFFKGLLGPPKHQYPDKEYVIYHCPFTDHNDDNPSFLVHKRGYTCYGCERSGNYWQFLKDYYGWNNNQVKTYLKKIGNKIN